MKPDLNAFRARWPEGRLANTDAREDVLALLAYIEELESRVTYTVGETEWAHRIAVAEQRFVDEYDRRKASNLRNAMLEERALTAEERLEQCEHELEQQARVWEQAMAEAQTNTIREVWTFTSFVLASTTRTPVTRLVLGSYSRLVTTLSDSKVRLPVLRAAGSVTACVEK